MMPWIIGFIAFDIVVTVGVLLWVTRNRTQGGGLSIAGINLGALNAYCEEMHPRIGEYMRANWSGVPDQLPPVLDRMLDELVREAQQRGLPFDRDVLKHMLRGSVARHGVAKGRDLDEALAKVA